MKRQVRVQVIEHPVIAAASIGAALKKRFRLVNANADVAILDCNSIAGDTAALVRELRAGGARVLVLSSSSVRGLVGEALRAGAEGFLARLKDWNELAAAVRAIAAGRNVYGEEVAAAFSDGSASVLDIIDGQTWELDPVRTDGKRANLSASLTLSPREAQILQLVATGQSNGAIAPVLNISVHTVRKHRENLMVKLKLHNVAEVAAFAVRNNLIATPEARGVS